MHPCPASLSCFLVLHPWPASLSCFLFPATLCSSPSPILKFSATISTLFLCEPITYLLRSDSVLSLPCTKSCSPTLPSKSFSLKISSFILYLAFEKGLIAKTKMPKQSSTAISSTPITGYGTSSANPDDWTKVSNKADRRRIQNRISQRNYRG